MKHSRFLAVTLALALVAFIPVKAFACGCNNQNPFASFTFSQTGATTWSFNGSSSFDPDGWIVSYHWDFGDGSTATTSTPYVSHFYGPGEYYVTLTVTDNGNACNATTQYVKTCGGPGQGDCPY